MHACVEASPVPEAPSRTRARTSRVAPGEGLPECEKFPAAVVSRPQARDADTREAASRFKGLSAIVSAVRAVIA